MLFIYFFRVISTTPFLALAPYFFKAISPFRTDIDFILSGSRESSSKFFITFPSTTNKGFASFEDLLFITIVFLTIVVSILSPLYDNLFVRLFGPGKVAF